MMQKIMMSVVRILLAVLLVIVAVWFVAAQPGCSDNSSSTVSVDPARLQQHVRMLSEAFHPRNWQHPENLDKCAAYIRDEFDKAGGRTEEQVYEYGGIQYRNVIARFGPEDGKRLIVGAHYDSCADTPGADDNASGVSALIELAYMLGKSAPSNSIELVAYTLEEPPFFRTEHMGSAVHADRIHQQQIDVVGVIIFEMVGYFSDEPNSQAYPSKLLHLMYPSRGNFLAVVGKWDQGRWIKAVKSRMKGVTDLPIRSIRAPTSLPGVDFSDHLNYWAKGYDAVMLTDTAFYRNREYHTVNDTYDRLDYDRMGMVVVAAYEMIIGL